MKLRIPILGSLLGAALWLLLAGAALAQGIPPIPPVRITAADIRLVADCPTKNDDGTALTDLVAIRFFRLVSNAWVTVEDVAAIGKASATTGVFTVQAGTNVFGCVAVAEDGETSDGAYLVWLLGGGFPSAPGSLRVHSVTVHKGGGQ